MILLRPPASMAGPALLARAGHRVTMRPTHPPLVRRHLSSQHHQVHESRPVEKPRRTRTGSSFPQPVWLLSTAIASGGLGYLGAQWIAEGTRNDISLNVPDNPSFGTPQDFERGIAELRLAFGENAATMVSTDPDDLHVHGFSLNGFYAGVAHSVIVYPRSTEDVVNVVKVATKYRIPVIPYSGATSLEGQFRGHRLGGICVDLNHMNKIIQINVDDSDIVCQPAARWMDINELLKEKGVPLFFPIDPGPGATIGGMLSTACSGTNAVRYGTARGEWFLNCTVVLPSGEVIKTRRRSRKSAAGLDMTKLFVGAEGTLGIVTEVTIRLAPLLPTTVAVVHFPDIGSATAASIEVINQGVGIQCVELLDSLSLKAVNIWGQSKRVWPEKDSLFFKFQGPAPASLKETAAVVKKIVAKHGGTGFSLARDDKEAEEFWNDRKNLYWSGQSLLEGDDVRAMTTDVCVPVSKLPQLVSETKKDLESVGLVHSIVGHVGDGNFHALILFKTDEDLETAHDAVKRISKRAIALDGTCTGEHGVGIGKREYLVEELGEGTVELMKTIKRAIDPLGLFNPGKLYPETSSSKREKKRHWYE